MAENNKRDKVKVSKVWMAVVIAVILTFAASAFVFVYLPKIQKQNEIKEYKQVLYDSILCQYSCPLIEKKVGVNKTDLVPEPECVKECSLELNAKIASGVKYTEAEVSNDDLLKDMRSSIDVCKRESFDNSTLAINSSEFFVCVKSDLVELKEKYSYV